MKRPGPTTKLKKVFCAPLGRRVPEQQKPRGVAIPMVLLAILLMSAIVTDFGYNELVRYRLAANQRDALKARALAEGGLNISRLLLSIQSKIQPGLTEMAKMGVPLPSYTVWDFMPVDSELMRGLTDGSMQNMFGMDVSSALAQREEKMLELRESAAADFDPSADGAGDKPFERPAGGFGGFDGTFSVEIEDEEKKPVSLRGWGKSPNPQQRFTFALRLFALFQPERYDFLFEERDQYGNRVTREELVANIFDWIDANEDETDGRADAAEWGRAGGGAESSSYTSYEPSFEPKDAYFDSLKELRRVHGITDAHMKAFADSISVYGENKINILSAPQQTIETLIRLCAVNPNDAYLYDPLWMSETLGRWQECKSMGMIAGCQISAEGFLAIVQMSGLQINEEVCKNNISTESKHFTVRASATVGDVTRTITTVVRVYNANEEFYFFSVR